MSALARKQQALLAALFDWPYEDATQNIANYADEKWARGLKVYQANGHALACNALRAAYPVVAQLLGEESFDALARALWHAQPPLRGDAAQWGGALPEFVRVSDQLASEPYLPDVAALEWALHLAASAADASADPSSFALLADHDPADLALLLGDQDEPGRWRLIAEFIEGYRWLPLEQRWGLIADEPAPTGDQHWDVFLAALAEHLRQREGRGAPGAVAEGAAGIPG